jgi:hypothetical protein
MKNTLEFNKKCMIFIKKVSNITIQQTLKKIFRHPPSPLSNVVNVCQMFKPVLSQFNELPATGATS